jgi:hypothetical protein
MIQISTTSKEFDAYCKEFDTISDLDMCYNSDTDEYDLPSIEWDGYMGKYWQRFYTESARQEALDLHTTRMNAWVLEYRKEETKRLKAKKLKAKQMWKNRTLGGQHPELAKLKAQFRKSPAKGGTDTKDNIARKEINSYEQYDRMRKREAHFETK